MANVVDKKLQRQRVLNKKIRFFLVQMFQHVSNGRCGIFRLRCQKLSALSSGVYVTLVGGKITILPEIITD